MDHWNDLEGGIFVMELLEVLRRWLWVFLRAETEWGEYIVFAGSTLWAPYDDSG